MLEEFILQDGVIEMEIEFARINQTKSHIF